MVQSVTSNITMVKDHIMVLSSITLLQICGQYENALQWQDSTNQEQNQRLSCPETAFLSSRLSSAATSRSAEATTTDSSTLSTSTSPAPCSTTFATSSSFLSQSFSPSGRVLSSSVL